MGQHAERRREALDLGDPLFDDAHRADDERRPECVRAELLPLGREHRDRLHGLAEAHVVGEDRTDAEIAEHPQPAVAALLEREELMRHRRRRRECLEPPLVVPEERGERLVERDLAELEAGLVGVETRHRADELDDARAAAATFEELERALDLGLPERVPPAGDPHERIFCLRELHELFLAQRGIADGDAPVEAHQLGRREQSARARRRGAARRTQVDAQLPRPQPGAREEHGHPALDQLRHRLAQEAARSVDVERRLRRLGALELDPVLREERLDLAELADEVLARVARAQKREDAVPAVPHERGRQAERGVVVRLQPQLEHELCPAAGRPLVEVQTQLPRSGRAARERTEAVVHPARQLALQRRVAGVLRQQRLRRAEPLDEELERRRAQAGSADERDAVGAEAVARDPVDDDRVQVVDGRVAIAVERIGGDRRQRCCDLGERCLHRRVERRAPERMPAAVAVLEIRMHEAFCERPVRELDDRECAARAPAELEVGRRVGREGDELRDTEPARLDSACERQIGGGGTTDRRGRRQRASRPRRERTRTRSAPAAR